MNSRGLAGSSNAAGHTFERRRQQEAWKAFWNLVASDMYGAAREHITEDGADPGVKELNVAAEMIEHLSSEVGLDTDKWLAWVSELNGRLPEDTAAPAGFWPEHLPTPPEEPLRAATDLVKRTGHNRLEGIAASWILYHLSLARAVRQFQRN